MVDVVDVGTVANDGTGDSLRVGGQAINAAMAAFVAGSLPAGSVTNALLDDMAEATFKMRAAGAGTGAPIDGTATQARTALGLAAVATSGSAADLTTGTLPIARIADGAITSAKFRDSTALTVIGRAANSTGVPADIAAASNGQIFYRSSNTLLFGNPEMSSLRITLAAAGATERVASAKAAETVTVTDFGGVGDDSTNNDAAFAAANTYLVTLGGGTIHVPPGTFRISNAIALSANVNLIGDSLASAIKTTHASNSLFTTAGGNVVTGLSFSSSVTRTSGVGAEIASDGNIVIIDNTFNGFINTISIGTASSLVWVVRNSIYTAGGAATAGILVDGASAGNDAYIYDNFIRAVSEVDQPQAGIKVVNTGAVWLRANSVLWCGNGLLVQPTNGKTVAWLFDVDSAYDTGSGHGILIAPDGTGVVKGAQFVGTWTATNAENGFTVGAGTGTTNGVEFIAHRSLNNTKHGGAANGGVEFHVLGGVYAGNNGAAGSYDGINIAAAVSEFSISNIRSGDALGFSASQRYGIRVETGASDNYKMTLNDCRGNTTGGISDAGTGTNKQVFGNLPIDSGDRLRSGGVNFNLPLGSGWQIDSDAASFTIATGAETVLTTGSGMLIFTDSGTGGTAIFVTGGGGVALIGQTGTTFAATSTPSASQLGLYYSGGTYRLKNGFAGTRTIYPGTWKTRPSN